MVHYLLVSLTIEIAMLLSTVYAQDNSQTISHDSQTEFFTGQTPSKLLSQADFYTYTRILDEEFEEALKEIRHDYAVLPGIPEPPGNNLVKEPVFNSSRLDIASPVQLPFSGVTVISDPGGFQAKSFARVRKPESDSYTFLTGNFLFYGQQITVKYDKLLPLSITTTVSADSIAAFWHSFSRANSNHLADQLMDYRDRLGLGDWGFFQLVKATSACILKDNQWSQDQLNWALMIRSGFDVRLAFSQSSTTILFPSENILFNRQFAMIGQRRFYLDREMKNLLLATYPNPFPAVSRAIDLRLYKSLNLTGKITIQKFKVDWNKKRYEFAFRVNPELVRFYKDYPKTDPAIYFGAPVSSAFKEDLLRQLYPILSKMNKAEAAALLQKFVQQEFAYCLENRKEKISSCFADELVASKAGDDRGKAVLYSWLTRILLRLPVVGLQFPGYYSTAICFSEPLDGDSYLFNRERYLISDPTCRDIPIGVLMPELSGKTPKLIDLTQGPTKNNNLKIWNLAFNMGARRGGASQDAIFDRQGRSLITGYFESKGSKNPFLASFSEGNALQWIRKFEVDGKAVAYAITKANEDEIYIAGSFIGKLRMDDKTIQSAEGTEGLFIAQFNQLGELIWMKGIPVDSTKQKVSLPYLVKFDRSGNTILFHWINEDERNVKPGFVSTSEPGLVLMGSGVHGSLISPPKFITGDNKAGITKFFNRLTAARCNPKVTPILAVLKWLQNPGNEVSGVQIQELITGKMPAFRIENPALFTLWGRINVLKNENGIISLKTSDYKSLVFNSLRIENGARFVISIFGNGDTSLGVISGFQNIGNPVLLPLNNLLIDFSSGNMIMDYDYDHTLKTIFPNP